MWQGVFSLVNFYTLKQYPIYLGLFYFTTIGDTIFSFNSKYMKITHFYFILNTHSKGVFLNPSLHSVRVLFALENSGMFANLNYFLGAGLREGRGLRFSNFRHNYNINKKVDISTPDKLVYDSKVGRKTLFLENGEYGYIRDVKLPNKLEWKSHKSKSDVKKIGEKIGWFSDEKSLSNYGDFRENVNSLKKLFDSFSPINSYSLAVMISSRNNIVKTIDCHYLVNRTTDCFKLMDKIYSRISELTTRYRFEIRDVILCKFKALHVKVKDPNFTGNKIENTIFKPTSTKLSVFNRLLSPSFLPHTMNINFYGELIKKDNNFFYFIYNNNKYIIKLEILEENINHKIWVFNNETGWLIAVGEDLSVEDGFIREFTNIRGKNTYVKYDNEFNLINIEFEPKISYLNKIKKDFQHKNNIITFDIEAYRNSQNNFIPYACGFYKKGVKPELYYLSDFNDNNEMINKFLKDLISPKHNNYTAYAHNFSRFDSVFLFKKLKKEGYKLSNLIPKNNGFISFIASTKVKNKTVKVKFSDSIALLPSSLEDLTLSFKTEVKKDIFPYNFVNEFNLNYEGSLPEFIYYNDGEYDLGLLLKYQDKVRYYINKTWSVKDETLKYLIKDLISLYQVLMEVDKIIFSNYRINITAHPTIASLSISILRSNFLKDNNLLPKSKGELEEAIRMAYYGGRVEVIKPQGKYLYCYDYNGLYSYSMLQDMPVGQPTFSLYRDLSKIFGFVKVKVKSPEGIYVPVLPCKIKTKSGDEKLIFPVGSWTAWYFSEEVKLAVRYGYKVEVLESYIYKRGKNVFKEYVDHMASIKDNSTGAMRQIHKLLLNTPYGRMGMNNIRDKIDIVSKKEFESLELKFNIINSFEISENEVFVKYSKLPDPIKCEQSGFNYDEEIIKIIDSDVINNSPAIAAAVSSWARITMYPIITKAFYTDTDSVFLKNELNPDLVGKEIGKFKQEYGGVIKKAIFPSNKLYFLDTLKGAISKNKGYSGKLSLHDYIELYNGGFLEVTDKRWKPLLELETVKFIPDQKYLIKSDYDKRNKIYSLGKWIDTSPLLINDEFKIITLNLIKHTNNTALATIKKNFILVNLQLIKYTNNTALANIKKDFMVVNLDLIIYYKKCTYLSVYMGKHKNNNLYLVKCDISKQATINCFDLGYNFYKLIHTLSLNKHFFIITGNKISYTNIKFQKISNYLKLLGFILTPASIMFVVINTYDSVDVIINLFKENIEYITKNLFPQYSFHNVKENIDKISISCNKENINTENSFKLPEGNLRPYVANNFKENIILGNENIDINKINTTNNSYKQCLIFLGLLGLSLVCLLCYTISEWNYFEINDVGEIYHIAAEEILKTPEIKLKTNVGEIIENIQQISAITPNTSLNITDEILQNIAKQANFQLLEK